jgi:dsDNA-specific endonuclease/ATPase MutS2
MLSILQYNDDIPVIDLHDSESVHDALEKLDIGLSKFLASENYCRIVYGIGTGALRNAVFKASHDYSFISFIKEEEGGGSCIIFF